LTAIPTVRSAGPRSFEKNIVTRPVVLPGELTLAPAPQHPARCGDGSALAAAEQVFATDTVAAIAQLVTARASTVPA
jgi:hypothetical protein